MRHDRKLAITYDKLLQPGGSGPPSSRALPLHLWGIRTVFLFKSHGDLAAEKCDGLWISRRSRLARLSAWTLIR